MLIHAGKSVDAEAMKKFEQYGLEYPLGCVIAKATLADCVKVDDTVRNNLRHKNFQIYSGTTEKPDWDGYGFRLENIQPITPIAANGMLGLWEFDI